MTRNLDILGISLEFAVPLHILELRGLTADHLVALARAAAGIVAAEGDVLQFGGKPGAPTRAFNALALGLACLAHAPGGVSFAGRHWEAATSPLHPADMNDQRAELARWSKPITTLATGDTL